LTSAHQNDSKRTNYIKFKKKKLNFMETRFQPRSQTFPKIFFSYLNISPVEKDTVYYHPQTVMFVARKELVCKIRKQSRIQS
jgi:hypothetical protein